MKVNRLVTANYQRKNECRNFTATIRSPRSYCRNAELYFADLTRANLNDINLIRANLEQANLISSSYDDFK